MMQRLQQEMENYRPTADAAGFAAFFVVFDAADQWRPETVLTVPAFLGLLLEQNPEIADGLIDGLRGGDPVKVEILAQALNYCRNPMRARWMERLAGEATAASMDEAGADFADFIPTHPVHVDMLWACRHATGDEVYVNRIVDLLAGWMPDKQLQDLLPRAGLDEEIGKTAMTGLLAKAAQITLTAHAGKADVRKVLEKRAALCDGPASALAARITAAAG